MIALALLALVAADPAPRHRAAIDDAFTSIEAGQPQAALEKIEPVIAAIEKENSALKQQVYCAMSPTETILYMAMAASAKKDAVAASPEWCEALFIRGYALIDLQRLEEARAAYRYLLTFAPSHAHYQTELGLTYRFDRNWPKMIETCTSAVGYADLAEKSDANGQKALAWRCMGYALIEQGKWDEAAALYRKCLELDPNDAKAKNELSYIAEQRGKLND